MVSDGLAKSPSGLATSFWKGRLKMSTTHLLLAGFMFTVGVILGGQAFAAEDNDARARKFIAQHEATIQPLEIEVGRQRVGQG